MKRVLSLDVGVTTGYAVHYFHPFSLIETGTLHADVLRKHLDDLKLLHMPSYTVAERPVIVRGPLGDQLENVMSIVRVMFDHQVEFVDPATWKQTPFSEVKCPSGLTPHERDAIRLGAWFCDTLKKRLQGQ